MEPLNEPTCQKFRWPDPDEGPHLARLWFGHVNGKPGVVGVEMWGVEPVSKPWTSVEGSDKAPTGGASPFVGGTIVPARPVRDAAITAEEIRLPLGALLDAWLEQQHVFVRTVRTLYGGTPGQEERLQRFEQRLQGERSGRPRLTDEFLQRVAEVYQRAVSEGSRSPSMAVADQLDAAVPDTARSWVRQARKRGFLEKGTR